MKKVIIYTDGSCLGNPGPGGWGAILTLTGTTHRRELSGGYRLTTNNRMEIMASIEGLKALKEPCEVEIVTDSQYLCNAISKGWMVSWRARNWIKKNGKPVPNVDLWQALIALLKIHKVTFNWIRGHAGHEENELCDALAKTAAQNTDLPADAGYENLSSNRSLV